mgnify:CR=1 FL=1
MSLYSLKDDLTPCQPIMLPLFLRQSTYEIIFNGLKACLPDTVRIVLAISAHMIILAEQLLPSFSVGNAWIRPGFLGHGVKKGHLKDGKSARLQHPRDFLHRLDIVRNMLKNVIAQYGVKGAIVKRHPVNVHFYFCQGRLDVGSDIGRAMHVFKTWDETGFRGDMEHGSAGREEGRALLQVEPDEPMPLRYG